MNLSGCAMWWCHLGILKESPQVAPPTVKYTFFLSGASTIFTTGTALTPVA